MNAPIDTSKPIDIAVCGLGTVGYGTVELLQKYEQRLERMLGRPIRIKKAIDLREEPAKELGLSDEVYSKSLEDAWSDPEIRIVVELVGGHTVSREIVLNALEAGKHVVTANKALLAYQGEELFALAAEKNLWIGFEASVGGGIPIIRTLRDHFVVEDDSLMAGIVNGTCNYILAEMSREGRGFDDVLAEAQQLGYAEADPTLDVGGGDAAHKLALLLWMGFGHWFGFEGLPYEGIDGVDLLDVGYAQRLGYELKLLAVAKRHDDGVEYYVGPVLIPEDSQLAAVTGSLNALLVRSSSLDTTFLVGHGAGRYPTASSVVGDIVEIARQLDTGLPSPYPKTDAGLRTIPLGETRRKFYLRFVLEDVPGVLAKLTGILGNNGISIHTVMQLENKPNGDAVVAMLTALTSEQAMADSLAAIEELDETREPPVFLRIEEELET